jgi:prolipoprotein diacylglyceryltransferase
MSMGRDERMLTLLNKILLSENICIYFLVLYFLALYQNEICTTRFLYFLVICTTRFFYDFTKRYSPDKKRG